MNISADHIKIFLLVSSTLIGLIAWFIRLESKVRYLERDHEKNKDAVWRKIDELRTDTKQVLLTLARIEETLKHINKDH